MTRPGGLTDGGRVPLPGAVALVVLVGLALVAPLFPAGAGVSDTKIGAFAGTGQEGFAGDGGLATSAQLKSPLGLAVDATGRVYLADSRNNRVRRIDANGTISTIAGTGTYGSTGDGGLATSAAVAGPAAVAVDASGGVLIATGNRIRRVDPTGKISTLAGSADAGATGDGGPAKNALLSGPQGVVVGPDGLVYVADTGNNRIRRIAADGTISTFAGGGTAQPPGWGDGGLAAAATLNRPEGIAFGPDGSLYVVDANTDSGRIRKVDPTGNITTVAGGGTQFVEGAQGPSVGLSLSNTNDTPSVAVDPNGDLYISDSGQHAVRRLQPDGRIFNLAGTAGVNSSTGDGGPATSATLNSPSGVAVLSSGVVLVAESVGNRIRRIQPPPLRIDDTAVAEGNSGVTHAVLNVTVAAHSQAFSVDWATADGTATTADHDYVAASGTLNFAANEFRKTIDLSVNGDTAPENDETFSVRLNAHGKYPDVAGTVTIVNDDGAIPVFSASDTSALESDSLVFTVTKSGTTSRTVRVDYATSDGTATTPADYGAVSGTLSFGPTETSKTVTVPVVNDELQEADETVKLTLSNPVDAAVDRVHGFATGTILDDDVARWTATGAMDGCGEANGCVPRNFQTATLLDAPACHSGSPPVWCGKVLAAGGGGLASAELYDPGTGTWSPTGSMHESRQHSLATLLTDGRVLVAYGIDTDNTYLFRADAEIYDPNTGQWTMAAAPSLGREGASSTLLPDGTLLVAGGWANELNRPPVDLVEIYDPASNVWRRCTAATATRGCPAQLPEARESMTTTMLPDGRVLMTGGFEPNPDYKPGYQNVYPLTKVQTAYLYDPASGRWSSTSPLLAARTEASAFLLTTACGDLCGKVIVIGGDWAATVTAEVYDPATAKWTFTASPPFEGQMTKLPDGTILAIDPDRGGAALFDPVTQSWRATHSTDARSGFHVDDFVSFTATVLDGVRCGRPSPPTWCGTVLVAGGLDGGADGTGNGNFDEHTVASAWLYHPAPTVRSAKPAIGPSAGGNKVVISGVGLAGTTWVHFGDAPSPSFTVDSATQITATAPPQASGKVSLAVRTPAGGLSTVLADAYTYGESLPPSRVTDLAAKATSDTDVELTWSASSADGTFPPPAGTYVVKVSKSTITDASSFDAAPALCGGACSFVPTDVGSQLTLGVHKLTAGTQFHFSVRAVNDVGLASDMSNEAVATTTGQAPPEPAPSASPSTTVAPAGAPTATTVAAAATATPTTVAPAPVPASTTPAGVTPLFIPVATSPAVQVSPTNLSADAPISFTPTPVIGGFAVAPTPDASGSRPASSSPSGAPGGSAAPGTVPSPSPVSTGTTIPTPTTVKPGATESAAGPSTGGHHRSTPVWVYIPFGIVGFAAFAFLGALANKRLRGPTAGR